MGRLCEELAARGMHGMKLGLSPMREACLSLGSPELSCPAVHIAGTSGKGAVAAILDAALGARGLENVARYTSPHLVKIAERFFIGGKRVDDEELESAAEEVFASEKTKALTYFETLTAVAFVLFSRRKSPLAVLECGLGGRLDATNVCNSVLSVITKVGLDHCDWLGDTIEKISAEKSGIIRAGVPVVLGRNDRAVRAVVESRAKEMGAPFFYAPDIADESEIPSSFSLEGLFNRENALTAIAALKVLEKSGVIAKADNLTVGFSDVVWPGRFHRIGGVIIDGAHNPPAAEALASSLSALGLNKGKLVLVAGFCGDKDVEAVLQTLAPFVSRAVAVRTDNPRSLDANKTASLMRQAGMEALAASSLEEALILSGAREFSREGGEAKLSVLICGSLFLAGSALCARGAMPYDSSAALEPAERLRPL